MPLHNGMPASQLTGAVWRRLGSVELAVLEDGRVAMRNASDASGPALIYTRAEIEALIGGAKDGDFDGLLA
ncbi:MAG: DUF397 domain-containing protein [Streptosporangiaceae bacterium]